MKVLLQVLLAVAVIAALSGGIVLLVKQSSGKSLEILLPTPTPELQIQVYVSGAVENPGLYTLREGERVAQAVQAAGGPTEEADLERVNLAARVQDEDHWHIPRIGEEVTPVDVADADGRININVAPVALLESLPQIGPVRAQAIVAYREANGPFSRVEDITNVPGIYPSTLDAIRDLVTAD